MTKTSGIIKPFFSHDMTPREDKKIKKLINEMGFEGYGLYWATVEFMHQNELIVGEEDLVLDNTYTEKIYRVLNEFKLFYTKDNYYVSDRIIRNICKQEESTESKKKAITTRWLLADFKKYYTIIFKQEPVLTDDEIKVLKNYADRIPNLRDILPDLIYTLKELKFKTDTKFVPSANWLLAKNNLAKLVNGEFGKLKHFVTDKEKKESEKQQKEKEELEQSFDINLFHSKIEAIEYIVKKNTDREITQNDKKLMEKFDITLKELTQYRENLDA